MTDTQRYLGSGTVPRDETSLTGEPPAHLPRRLTVCLWDFSWYTQAGPGQPYEDLDAVCAELAARGFNTIRVCAAPLLTFGGLGLDDIARDLEIEGMGPAATGGYLGQRTRWYDTPGGYRLDLVARLTDLFEAAQKHDLVVILSSWEYQQSSAFARSRRWFDAIDAVPLNERYAALSRAWDVMIGHLTALGHRDRIALVEMHNEVDFSLLPPLETDGVTHLQSLAEKHPDLLVTASYGKPPHLAMHELPTVFRAAQFHVYCYGVLDVLQQRVQIRGEGVDDFPNAALRELLLPAAPAPGRYGRAQDWKYRATVVTDRMIYGYDWINPEAWDAWLHHHYGPYRAAMLRETESRVIAISRWARASSFPAVIGEGWIGYTPLDANFEESADGHEIAAHGIRTALDHGIWGMVLGSNVAPHHPSWTQAEWHREMNSWIVTS